MEYIELFIAMTGAVISIIIAIIGAILNYRYNIKLKQRNLKETYYIEFITQLHNFAGDNKSKLAQAKFTKARDQLLIIASEKVLYALKSYEEKIKSNNHNVYLNILLKEIRKDLNIKDKNLPTFCLVK